MDKRLIIHRKGEKILTKVVYGKYNPPIVDYQKVLNPYDYKDLVQFFRDLKNIIGAPVDKAIAEFTNKKETFF